MDYRLFSICIQIIVNWTFTIPKSQIKYEYKDREIENINVVGYAVEICPMQRHIQYKKKKKGKLGSYSPNSSFSPHIRALRRRIMRRQRYSCRRESCQITFGLKEQSGMKSKEAYPDLKVGYPWHMLWGFQCLDPFPFAYKCSSTLHTFWPGHARRDFKLRSNEISRHCIPRKELKYFCYKLTSCRASLFWHVSGLMTIILCSCNFFLFQIWLSLSLSLYYVHIYIYTWVRICMHVHICIYIITKTICQRRVALWLLQLSRQQHNVLVPWKHTRICERKLFSRSRTRWRCSPSFSFLWILIKVQFHPWNHFACWYTLEWNEYYKIFCKWRQSRTSVAASIYFSDGKIFPALSRIKKNTLVLKYAGGLHAARLFTSTEQCNIEFSFSIWR